MRVGSNNKLKHNTVPVIEDSEELNTDVESNIPWVSLVYLYATELRNTGTLSIIHAMFLSPDKIQSHNYEVYFQTIF